MLQLLTGLEARPGLRDFVTHKLGPDGRGVAGVVDPCSPGWPDASAARFARLAIR